MDRVGLLAATLRQRETQSVVVGRPDCPGDARIHPGPYNCDLLIRQRGIVLKLLNTYCGIKVPRWHDAFARTILYQGGKGFT